MDRSANYLMHAASKAILPEVWNLREQNINTPGSQNSTYGNSIIYHNGTYWQLISNYWGTWPGTNQPILKYSTDLKSWTRLSINTGIGNWGTSTGLSTLGVAANGNTIIVVGGSGNGSIGHRIWRSGDNGATWTTVSFGAINGFSDAYYKIVYGNGKWLALGPKGMAVSSDDGLNWNLYGNVTQGPYSNAYNLDRIVYRNGLWLAPGQNGKLYTHENLDTSTWFEYTISIAGTNHFKSVEYINGTYVLSYGSTIIYSGNLNGTWATATNITLPNYASSSLKDIIRISKFSVGGTTERLVATGYPDKIHYSDDGASWTSVSVIHYTPDFQMQSYQGSYISDFVNGPNNTIIYVDVAGNWASSSNAISWSLLANFTTWGDIIYNPVSSKFFGIKMGNSALVSSSNGLDWSFVAPIQGNLWNSSKKVKFDNTWQYGVNHMVSGGRYTTNYGNTWTYFSEYGGLQTTGTTHDTGYLSCVVWTGQYFYIIGYTTFKRSLPTNLSGTWSSAGPSFMEYEIIYDAESNGSGGIVVIPGSSGLLVYSNNHGNTWSNTNNTSWKGSRQPMGTAYSPTLDMLITVGEYDYIARSTDNGNNWTWPTLSGGIIYYCGTWTGSRFVVGGYGYTLNGIYAASRARSTDGITWTQDNFGLASDYMYDIETNSNYSATIGVCGGNQYKALVSTDQGINWTSYNMSSNPGSVCFITNSIVIAAGKSSNYGSNPTTNIQRSTNTGQTWTTAYSSSVVEPITPAPAYPGYGATCMRPVINGDGSVVILFCQNQTTTQTGVLVSTNQGSNWSLNYISGLYGVKIQAYWDGSQFVAHTNIGRRYTSTDGINWTEGVLPTTAYFPPPKDFIIKRGSPASTNRIWGDQDSRAYSSDNGATWQCYNNIFGWDPRRIIWDGSRYIIITWDSTYIFTATNPATSWTPIANVTIPGNSTIGGNLKLISIKYNSIKGKYYIGATDSLTKITYILSSSDLTSWSVKSSTLATNTSTAVELYAGAFSSTRSIMAGNYNTLATYP